MPDLKITVHRNQTRDPNDEAGIRQFHEDRANAIRDVIDTTGLELKGQIRDTDESGRPREFAELIVALGTAGVFTAAVQAFKIWIDRKKITEVEITPEGIRLSNATAEDVQRIARHIGL